MEVSVEIEPASWHEGIAAISSIAPMAGSQKPSSAEPRAWGPALNLVELAVDKIAFYELSFAKLEEKARRDTEQAEADKRRLMARIEALGKMLQESEANYEKTLNLLASSMQLCALQRMELRQMGEMLSEANSTAAQVTDTIKQLKEMVAPPDMASPRENG